MKDLELSVCTISFAAWWPPRREPADICDGEVECGKKIYKIIARACRQPLCNVICDRTMLAQPSIKDFHCAHCVSSFATHQSLMLHLFKVHNIRNVIQRCVGMETHCIVCLKMFRTRERVVNHVRYRSKPCRDWHLKYEPYFSQEQADGFDADCMEFNRTLQAKCYRGHKAATPCVQLCGPLVPIDVLASSWHHFLGRGHN